MPFDDCVKWVRAMGLWDSKKEWEEYLGWGNWLQFGRDRSLLMFGSSSLAKQRPRAGLETSKLELETGLVLHSFFSNHTVAQSRLTGIIRAS